VVLADRAEEPELEAMDLSMPEELELQDRELLEQPRTLLEVLTNLVAVVVKVLLRPH
jgi:hypothetical protein